MRLPSGLARVAVLVTTSALLVGGALVPTAASARAAAPAPKVRTFASAVVDDFPRWERENTCSPTEKIGAKALRTLLRKTYGATISSSTVRSCTRSDSGHEEGRAVDWMTSVRVPAQKKVAEAFLAWLQAPDAYGNQVAMARRLGIEYVIWNNRMWRTYDPARGWTPYSTCIKKKMRKKKFDTTCHRNHVHISLSWDGAYERTSYFSHYVACPQFPTPWPVAPAPADTTTPVSLPAARVLDTIHGVGTPTGPCRVHSGVRFDLPVLGVGGVPATGVSSVILQVALVSPDTPTTSLRVWPTGGVAPTTPVVAAGQPAAMVTVPVGANGMVSLQHGAGMSHVVADVVGYYPSPEPVDDGS